MITGDRRKIPLLLQGQSHFPVENKEECFMAGIVLRKTGVVLLTILKWILQAVLAALKLVFGIVKLFLLL